MGIPFYFASLCKKYAGIVREIRKTHPIEFDVFGIDFNCLIHRYIVDSDPVGSVVAALDSILNNVCRSKIVYIAVDGLVPYAKIVQQRYRRFRASANASAASVATNVSVFDRNQISPGTPYMKELEQAVRTKFPFAIMSGSLEAGEGEHKIFTFLKTLPASSRQQIGIYGLDADLILICLAHSQLGNIKLVRETGDLEVESEEQYATLNIAELARKIDIPIQQYVALCMLCFGNDFMPNLGMFSLREGGYERACEIYQKAGNPDLLTFEGRDAFLTCAGKREFETLKERIQLRKRPEEKAILGKSTSPELFSRKYGLHVLDGVENMAPVVDAFWKTFHWSVDYFMSGVPTNWDWYYPYPDAPLIMDILKNDESPIPAPAPLKYTINDQLQFILPSASLHRAKKRVIHADEMYGETRELWMKRHDWEAKPRISLPWNVANTHSSATK